MIDRIDRDEALRYLACRDAGAVGDNVAAYLDECERRLLEVIAPKYTYKYFPVAFENGQPVLVDCPLSLEGHDIAGHLAGCRGAALMCATLGAGADRLIRVLQVEDMAKAVIADAMAGAAIEQVCDEAERIIKSEIGGEYFTWRYSPGYGDFPIDIQKKFLDVLDAPRRIGLCTSESRMLTPLKSVTAVIGVSDSPIPQKRRGCAVCGMRESCNYRKRGLHCGYQKAVL